MNEEEKNVAGVEIGNLPLQTSVEDEKNVETPDNGNAGEPEPSAEETKVSYSRFSNVNSRRKEAERRSWELEQELEELKSQRETKTRTSDEPPKEWFEVAGGDTEQSRKAWNVLHSTFNPSHTEIEQLATRAWEQAQVTETRRVASNEQVIDDAMDDLSINVGRDLTDDEQLAVLELQDEYSVKDEDDRILRLFPAEKAWEIYQMESGAKRAPRKQARDEVASLTGSRSEGEPSSTGRSKNKDFDPSWGAWESQVSKLK